MVSINSTSEEVRSRASRKTPNARVPKKVSINSTSEEVRSSEEKNSEGHFTFPLIQLPRKSEVVILCLLGIIFTGFH